MGWLQDHPILRYILSSLFFGLGLSHKIAVSIIRICFWIFLISIHFVIRPNKWSQVHFLIFSGAVTALMLLIFMIFYILDKIIDKSFEEDAESSSLENVSEDQRPSQISKSLWEQKDILKNSPSQEEAAFQLINLGYQPEEVYRFIEEQSTKRPDPDPEPKIRKQKKQNFIRVFSTILRFPVKRTSISKIFPFHKKLSYIIPATILAFAQLYFICFNIHLYNGYEIVWAYIISGMSLYSMLQPPKFEVFSHLPCESFNGYSRAFYIALLSIFIYVFDSLPRWFGDPLRFLHFLYYIHWHDYIPFAVSFLKFGILLLPISQYFLLGPVHITFMWLLEAANRYMFGILGAPSIYVAILQSLRCIGIVFIYHYFYFKNSFKYDQEVLVIATYGILAIPLTILSWKSLLIYILESIFSIGINAIIIMFRVSIPFNYLLSLLCIFLMITISLTSAQVFFLFFVNSFTGKDKKNIHYIILKILYFLSPMFGAIFISTTISKEVGNPGWLVGVFVCIVINITGTYPLLFFATILFDIIVTDHEIRHYNDIIPFFILSYWLARKMMFLYPILREYEMRRIRLLFKYILYSEEDQLSFYEESLYFFFVQMARWFLLYFDNIQYPPTFFVSAVTGAPNLHFDVPGMYFEFPACPRPNLYRTISHSNYVSIKDLYTPVSKNRYYDEHFVFASITELLTKKLCSLVLTGKLGLVDENDYFICYENFNHKFMLQIVGISQFCVYFQVRGLPHSETTLCHNMEMEALETYLQKTKNPITIGIANTAINWKYVGDIKIDMYKINTYSFEDFLNDVPPAFCAHLLSAIARYCMKNPEVVNEISPDHIGSHSENDQFIQIAEELDFNLTDNFSRGINSINEEVLRLLGINTAESLRRSLNKEVFLYLFNGNGDNDFVSWLNDYPKVLSKIIPPAIRKWYTNIFEYYFSNDRSAINSNDFNAYPISSTEFRNAFVNHEKAIFTMGKRDDKIQAISYMNVETKYSLFRLNNSSVASDWSTLDFNLNLKASFGKNNTKLMTSYMDVYSLSRLVYDCADPPSGDAAFISPVLPSYLNVLE